MHTTILILGAAGHVGQALRLAFAQTGRQVPAQARKRLSAMLPGQPLIRALSHKHKVSL